MYLISDTHFDHHNIIRFCQRPFENVKHMNTELVLGWNDVVQSDDDIVLHVGDVGFDYDNLGKIIGKLRGVKLLVRGNHDYSIWRMEAMGFTVIGQKRSQPYEFEYGGRRFVVVHRPRDIPTWEEGDLRIRICGHEHNNAPHFIKWTRDETDQARPIMALNISCEYTDYRPIHIDDAIERWDAFMEAHRK